MVEALQELFIGCVIHLDRLVHICIPSVSKKVDTFK